MIPPRQKLRGMVVFGLVVVAMALLLGRLFDLQCLRCEMYQTRARAQHNSRERIAARRGRILDRNGSILAMSTTRSGMYADPKLVTDLDGTVRNLADLLGRPEADLRERLGNTRSRYVRLGKNLTDVQAIKARELMKQRQLRGVFLDELEERSYPKGDLLGNVLGICNEEGKGVEGIELQADRYLGGMDGYFMLRHDNRKKDFMDPAWVDKGQSFEPEDGQDVCLTIDEYIQHIAEQELRKAAEEYQPVSAMAVVMEPGTGAILAMALWPPFNPNDRTNYTSGCLVNRAASTVFEPGSTMKALTGAILLNEGLVDLDTRVFCENGHWQALPHRTLKDDHPLGEISFREVIQYSSNIGIAKMSRRIEPLKFHEYLEKFGLGRTTGILLIPHESSGILRPVKEWTRDSMVSLPMGQEVGVTSLQLLVAVATIANKGMRVRPTIVKRVTTAQGEVTPEARFFNYFEPMVVARNVVSSNAIAKITDAMVQVTGDRGTGKLAEIPGYTVAGKTGTAQKAGVGGYEQHKYVASFVGFVPASNPALVAIVVLDEPRQKQYYGGLVAAPVFGRICEEALAYLNVPKDAPVGATGTVVAAVRTEATL